MAKITAFTDLPYSGDHERCKLDLFRPAGETNAPLVVLIHGGGWTGGDRNQYHQTCIALAGQGYGAVSVGYRLLDDAAWPDMPQDIMRGLEYVHRNADQLGVDASRAVTLGSSAGGHLALVIQAKASQWVRDGVVAVSPEIIGTVAQCPAAILPVADEGRMARLANGHQIEELSPGHMSTELFASVLVIHGDADETIPLQKSRQFVDKLKAAAVDAKLEVLKGAGHAFAYRLNQAPAQEALKLTMPYLEKLLKP